MMTGAERAKQFMPFDAMKGLQEALRDREERHSRVSRRTISEEVIEHNSRVLQKIEKGTTVKIAYYRAFHDVVVTGTVTEINKTFRFLRLGDEQVFFDDIYKIIITGIG